MFITCLKNGKALKIIFMALLVGLFCPLMMWGQILGDVDSSGTVDIIDALLTAQYYVDMNPENFQTAYADVDGNSDIDIVDALLMAQFYVGLIKVFPADVPDPTTERTVGNRRFFPVRHTCNSKTDMLFCRKSGSRFC